jgi:hypothetical protein
MADSYELGLQFREFLRGFVDDPTRTKESALEFGPRINTERLPENFKGTKVKPFTVPPGGIDNLALHSTDIFTVPGKGEFQVDFSGYFKVARDNPNSRDWTNFEIFVNIIDLRLFGESKELGAIAVSLNRDVTSSGQIFPATEPNAPAKCRIATGVVFEMPQLGVKVFNKEPILLMNEHVTSIPPVDDPNGHALLFLLPLYDTANPTGKPVAHLTSLRYGADNYISRSQVTAFQNRKVA